MLLIKNKVCAPILQTRKEPHAEESWFSKDNSNPINFTLISRDSHVCLHPPEVSPSLKGYVIMKVTYHGEKEKEVKATYVLKPVTVLNQGSEQSRQSWEEP